MTLPFKLHKYHKSNTKSTWKKYGMKFTDEDFDLYIYPEYIKATHCDLCNNKFKSRRDRQLDHNHNTGEIRNIICKSCNQRKYDIEYKNTTGYKYISKTKKNDCKQGFIYRFCIQGKTKKYSISLDYLIKFRDDWLKENNYET
jgi:hypothetical protein